MPPALSCSQAGAIRVDRAPVRISARLQAGEEESHASGRAVQKECALQRPLKIHQQTFQPLSCHQQILGLLRCAQGGIHRRLDALIHHDQPVRRLLQPSNISRDTSIANGSSSLGPRSSAAPEALRQDGQRFVGGVILRGIKVGERLLVGGFVPLERLLENLQPHHPTSL